MIGYFFVPFYRIFLTGSETLRPRKAVGYNGLSTGIQNMNFTGP